MISLPPPSFCSIRPCFFFLLNDDVLPCSLFNYNICYRFNLLWLLSFEFITPKTWQFESVSAKNSCVQGSWWTVEWRCECLLKAAQFLISLSIHLTAGKKNDSRFRHRFTRFWFGPSGHHFAHFCPLCTCAPPAAIHWTVVYIGRRYNCIWFRYFIRVGVGDLGNFFFFCR